jgi:hypothetical protein
VNVKFPWFPIVALAAAALGAVVPAAAGDIVVTWDPVAGASGYHVYYGTQSGTYTQTVTIYTTTGTISGLTDCQPYFVAVKAFNAAGESPQFSNELSGWSRPAITSATPTTAMQGDQIVMDVFGSNFQSGAVVDLGNANVVITSTSVLACNHMQILATVEPTAKNIHAAKVGKLDLTVSNPDSVFGMKSQAFEVKLNPARFDINQDDATTKNRIDGKDTVYMARDFGLADSDPNYDPDDDFDGDGWIDGSDLAYIASNLGRCWSASAKAWSAAACPATLR